MLFTKTKLLAAAMLLCCLFSTVFSSAQDQVDTTFNNRMNYVFGRLEKNRVPNGFLRDYAFEFTNLNAFNGGTLVDSNYVDYTTLGDIYNTLVTSRIHTTATGLVGPAAWDSLWYTQRRNGVITLSGVFFNYARFADNAVSSGKLTIANDQFVDKYVSGTWQNPYIAERVFAIAPPIDYYEGKNLQIVLPANLWRANAASGISNINVDLGDGAGYRTLTPGTAINVSYADTGRKEWKFRLRLTTGAYLYSHASVRILNDPYNGYDPDGFQTFTHIGASDPETIGFMATEPHAGTAGRGFITIDYANADRVLRRPLIVAEGFDAGHILRPERWWGSQSIEDFLVDVRDDGNTNLRNILINNPQYDIIYVDWRIGTDDIQRNALLLETIIRWINAEKEVVGGVSQPNVIIGQSMGGLIARWALRDMENKGQNHQTRLFVSYDSPHQGANVPLGYQYLLKHARSLYVRAGIAPFVEVVQLIRNRVSPIRAANISNTPAARQMLINWVSNNFQVDNTVHNQWQTALRNMGYPRQFGIRVVAVSNGSECAVTQPYNPGANLLSYSGKTSTRFLSDIMLSFTTFGNGLVGFAAFATGQPAFLMGLVPGKNEIKYNLTINAQPNQSTALLYRCNVTYKKTWLWVIPVQVTITNRSYNANAATLPFDYYPGGQINDGLNLQNANVKNFLIKHSVTASHIQTFSFVPTASALDIGSGAVALTHGDYLTRYVSAAPPVAPRNSPFQNFITAPSAVAPPDNNEAHIDILPRNGNWLAAELNIAPFSPNCACPAGNPAIAGPLTICTDALYTLNGVPAGAVVTWSASPAGIVSIAPSGNGTQATATRVSTGNVTITASVANTCGQPGNTSLPVYSGGYTNANYDITGPDRSCANTQVDYYINTSLLGVTSYNWVWPSGWTYVSGQGTSHLTVITGSNSGEVQLYVEPSCNQSGNPANQFVGIYSCFAYTVSPNPASSEVIVMASEDATNNRTAPTEITELNIYDQQGQLRKQQKYSKVPTARLSISSLPVGIYFIEIVEGAKKTRQQLSIVK